MIRKHLVDHWDADGRSNSGLFRYLRLNLRFIRVVVKGTFFSLFFVTVGSCRAVMQSIKRRPVANVGRVEGLGILRASTASWRKDGVVVGRFNSIWVVGTGYRMGFRCLEAPAL